MSKSIISCRMSFIAGAHFEVRHSLFDVLQLLDVLHFDIVGVMGQQVDGIRHNVLGQEGEELLCTG